MTKKKEPQAEVTIEAVELGILRQLETTDRSLKANDEERAESMHGFSETRKALEAIRDGLLRDLTDHRLGVRRLFDGDEPEVEGE